jgi:osmoprotectant transport system permease protein
MKGISLSMTDLMDGSASSLGVGNYSVLALMAFLIFLGFLTLLGTQKRPFVLLLAHAMGWILSLLPALLLILMSAYSTTEVVYDPNAYRMSLSTGFWLFLIGTILLQQTLPYAKGLLLVTTLALTGVIALGGSPHLSLYKEYLNVQAVFRAEFWRHLNLAFSSVAFTVLPGVLLGYWCHKSAKARESILGFVHLFQVIPTLSLLGLIMIPLTIVSAKWPILNTLGIRGIGFAPAFIVLCLYCLLPITANAYAGFSKVDQAITDSAIALGMTQRQVLWRVSVPLASPVIFSGIRIAVTQNIGNTILAGLIGGGGMGTLIFLGLSQSAADLVVLGTIPVVLMALLADGLFDYIEHKYLLKGEPS